MDAAERQAGKKAKPTKKAPPKTTTPVPEPSHQPAKGRSARAIVKQPSLGQPMRAKKARCEHIRGRPETVIKDLEVLAIGDPIWSRNSRVQLACQANMLGDHTWGAAPGLHVDCRCLSALVDLVTELLGGDPKTNLVARHTRQVAYHFNPITRSTIRAIRASLKETEQEMFERGVDVCLRDVVRLKTLFLAIRGELRAREAESKVDDVSGDSMESFDYDYDDDLGDAMADMVSVAEALNPEWILEEEDEDDEEESNPACVRLARLYHILTDELCSVAVDKGIWSDDRIAHLMYVLAKFTSKRATARAELLLGLLEVLTTGLGGDAERDPVCCYVRAATEAVFRQEKVSGVAAMDVFRAVMKHIRSLMGPAREVLRKQGVDMCLMENASLFQALWAAFKTTQYVCRIAVGPVFPDPILLFRKHSALSTGAEGPKQQKTDAAQQQWAEEVERAKKEREEATRKRAADAEKKRRQREEKVRKKAEKDAEAARQKEEEAERQRAQEEETNRRKEEEETRKQAEKEEAERKKREFLTEKKRKQKEEKRRKKEEQERQDGPSRENAAEDAALQTAAERDALWGLGISGRTRCKFDLECTHVEQAHFEEYSHGIVPPAAHAPERSFAVESPPVAAVSPQQNFAPPAVPRVAAAVPARCTLGVYCTQTNPKHFVEFSHDWDAGISPFVAPVGSSYAPPPFAPLTTDPPPLMPARPTLPAPYAPPSVFGPPRISPATTSGALQSPSAAAHKPPIPSWSPPQSAGPQLSAGRPPQPPYVPFPQTDAPFPPSLLPGLPPSQVPSVPPPFSHGVSPGAPINFAPPAKPDQNGPGALVFPRAMPYIAPPPMMSYEEYLAQQQHQQQLHHQHQHQQPRKKHQQRGEHQHAHPPVSAAPAAAVPGRSDLPEQEGDVFPPEFVDPITLDLMTDPVFTVDGHTYERASILEWLKHSNRSPQTGLELESVTLIPNHALRNSIQRFRKERGIE